MGFSTVEVMSDSHVSRRLSRYNMCLVLVIGQEEVPFLWIVISRFSLEP